MALWSGRFTKDLNAIADEYNSSIPVDHVMYEVDIKGSMAHARMLAACSIISEEDKDLIISGLEGILKDIKDGSLAIDMEAEDIHMFIEKELTDRIKDPGKRLHTARSRNDQVAVDMRLYIRILIDELKASTIDLIESLMGVAEDNLATIMPGYTHLQAAQPVSFAHHLMAYAQMLKRDLTRLEDCQNRLNESPLGSGALATTTYPIDRFMTAKDLGFRAPMANSMDGVSDRDFIIETIYCASMEMMHLSRLSEEIILWSTQEFNFIELDDSFSTGSSIMPQKKNPDMAELGRGKTGTVYGKLMGILSTMKGLPLAYNKDMQEDKEAVFESVDILNKSLKVMKGMVDTMKVNKEVMRSKASHGYIVATDLADYLTTKGMAFRDAYTLVGNIIRDASAQNLDLEEIPLERFKTYSQVFDQDLYDKISLETCVSKRNVYGGPAPEAVKLQIEEMREFLGSFTDLDSKA